MSVELTSKKSRRSSIIAGEFISLLVIRFSACRSWAEREDSQFCKFCGQKSVRKIPIRTDKNGNEYCILRPARRKIGTGNKLKPSRLNSRHDHSRTPVTSEDMLQMGGRRFELLRQEKAKKKLLEQAKSVSISCFCGFHIYHRILGIP